MRRAVGPREESNYWYYHERQIWLIGQGSASENWQTDSETVFKRLSHKGFKGRFATFKWLALTSALSFNFNESEYRAWKCGRGLAQFLGSFPPYYSKNLYSFSQGAVVCGAALTTYGASVRNYVISQGALPAGCYDPSQSVNSYQDFIEEDKVNPTPDYSNDLGYRNYLSGLNVTGQVSSFFNIRDYALKTGNFFGLDANWEANQLDYKPNTFSASSRTYAYDSGPPSSPFPIGQRCFLRKLNFALEERRLSDAHESMSFVARPRSEAVGARAQVGGKINTVPFNVGPDTASNFRDGQSDHGGQFSRRIQQTQDYYLQLGIRLGVLNSPQ